MANKPKYTGPSSTIVETNLNNVDKKKQLANIAYWKGYGSTSDLVRTILFRYIEETDDKYKRPRPAEANDQD